MSRTFMDIMTELNYITEELDEKIFNDVVAKPKASEWIPVTERLPENEHIVLITIKSTLSDDFYVMEALVGRIANEGPLLNGIRFYTERCGDINEQHGFNVIAWMPLPEPYSIESDGIGGGE